MSRQIPTIVAVIIIAIVVVVAAVLIWQRAGQKPVVGYEEFKEMMGGQPMGGPPGELMPAPRPPEKRGQPPVKGAPTPQ